MSILALPIMLLNFFSGVVGGIWLAILGHWNIVGIGLALTFVGAFVVSLLLMPGLLLIAPAAVSQRLSESKLVMLPLTLLSVGYTYCVMGVWSIAIFWYFAKNVGPDAAIPAILWSYSTATMVWGYMAQKEGNEYGAMSAFFQQIGCIALMIYTYNSFRALDIYEMAIWFAVPMTVSLFVQVGFMATMMIGQKRIS